MDYRKLIRKNGVNLFYYIWTALTFSIFTRSENFRDSRSGKSAYTVTIGEYEPIFEEESTETQVT